MGFLKTSEAYSPRNSYWEVGTQTRSALSIFLLLFIPSFASAINFIAFPVDHQLYQRDLATNTAIISIRGIIEQGEAYTGVHLKVYRELNLFEEETVDLNFTSGRAYFDFSTVLPSELRNFQFELYGIQDGEEVLIKKAEKVVVGDIILINGQSNAEAYASAMPSDLDEFARSYTADFNWNDMKYSYPGQWGGRLAKNIITELGIPVAIFNQAEGGKDIAYFLRDTNNSMVGNYGRLKSRLLAAGVEKVASIVWFQGEGDGWTTTIEEYKDRFKQLHTAWQEDYQPIFTYLYQIRFGSCEHKMPYPMEAQRQLAAELPTVGIMSSTNVGHDGCHFYYEDGYRVMADNLFQLMRKNIYGGPVGEVEAPAISQARQVTSTQIELEFSNVSALSSTGNPWADFSIEGSAATITAGRIKNNRLILTLSEAVTRVAGISYLAHTGSANDWIFNSNQIGILTFYNYPIEQGSRIASTIEPPVLADPDVIVDSPVLTEEVDCNGMSVTVGTNTLTIAGLNAPNVTVQVFDDQWELVYRCLGDCPNTTQTIDELSPGKYYVKVQLLQADWQLLCFLEDSYTIVGTNASIGECDNINIILEVGGVSVSGLDGAAAASILIVNPNYTQQYYNCWGKGCGGESTAFVPLDNGEYRVIVKYYDAAFEQICQKEELITISDRLEEGAVFSFRQARTSNSAQILRPTLEIYPTIVKDHLYINISNKQKLVTSLEIWSQEGQIVQRINANNWDGQHPIYIDNLAKGTYFLNAPLTDGSNLTRIFIIP